MSDTGIVTPRTKAGRELLNESWDDLDHGIHTEAVRRIADAIPDIEDESWNAALVAVEEAVGGLPTWDMGVPGDQLVGASACNWHAVLAAIASLRKPGQPGAERRQPMTGGPESEPDYDHPDNLPGQPPAGEGERP